MTTFYLLLISSCLLQWSNAFTPVVYDAEVPPSSQCGQSDPFEDDQQLMEKLKMIHQQLPAPGCNPPPTCRGVLCCNSSASSGYYQIQAANGSAVQVYCDMEGTNCGGEGGWMRVAYTNMTQSNATCPLGLTQKSISGLTLCDRMNTGCQSTFFSTLGHAYSRVCGQLQGYQQGTTDAFFSDDNTIDGTYVDGVSITYGSNSRKHIWTYASGHSTGLDAISVGNSCPCNTGANGQVPSFVGGDYYCETGRNEQGYSTQLYLNDTLWDGQQCVGVEAPCCTHPNMPWFTKTLSETTTEDIELRLCGDETTTSENVPLQVIELFVY